MYSDAEIADLINCRKVIIEKPKKEMVAERGHERNEMRLETTDKKHRFQVFLRRLIVLPERFSIGLEYYPPDSAERLILLRCNGAHGSHTNKVIDSLTISGCHIHKATSAAISAGLSSEAYATPTSAFFSYEQALVHFFQVANIEDSAGIVNPKWDTPSMFGGSES